jgi:hypothetical protein
MSGVTGELRQQVGEILATVRALDRSQGDLARHVEKTCDAIGDDLKSLKHETRNWRQAVSGRMELVQISQNKMEERLLRLEAAVEKQQAPLEELVNLRRRMSAFALLAVSIIGVFWALFSPVWEGILKRFVTWL